MTDPDLPDAPRGNQETLLRMVQAIAESQAKEVELKRQELHIRSQEIASNERIAMKAIEAQERFHIDDRVQYNKHSVHRYVYIILTVLLVCAFTLIMVMNGGKEVIVEVLKMALAAATGAFGGYHAGKSRKEQTDEE